MLKRNGMIPALSGFHTRVYWTLRDGRSPSILLRSTQANGEDSETSNKPDEPDEIILDNGNPNKV